MLVHTVWPTFLCQTLSNTSQRDQQELVFETHGIFSCQVRWMEISSWPKSSCGRSVRRTTSHVAARGNPHPHHRCRRWRPNPSLSPQRSQRQGWGLEPIWSRVSNLHSCFWAYSKWQVAQSFLLEWSFSRRIWEFHKVCKPRCLALFILVGGAWSGYMRVLLFMASFVNLTTDSVDGSNFRYSRILHSLLMAWPGISFEAFVSKGCSFATSTASKTSGWGVP